MRETHAEQREARMRQQKPDGSALQTPPRLVASPTSHEAASTPATRERPSTAGHEALRPAGHEALRPASHEALRPASHEALCATKTPLTSGVFK